MIIMKMLFWAVPRLIIIGLIFVIYTGISTYLSITGEFVQLPRDFEIQSVVNGKVFWPKVLRNNSLPLWIEMELTDLDRKAGETHAVRVNAADDCDYIEINDNSQQIVFEDQGKNKVNIKIPIAFRNVTPSVQCTIQILVDHENSTQILLSKTIPVDAISTKILAIGSALFAFIALLFSVRILR